MTQLRTFAKRVDGGIEDLRVETKVSRQWTHKRRIYKTAPKPFHFGIFLESSAPVVRQVELIQTAKKGCSVEQTLSVANTISHRILTENGFARTLISDHLRNMFVADL